MHGNLKIKSNLLDRESGLHRAASNFIMLNAYTCKLIIEHVQVPLFFLDISYMTEHQRSTVFTVWRMQKTCTHRNQQTNSQLD